MAWRWDPNDAEPEAGLTTPFGPGNRMRRGKTSKDCRRRSQPAAFYTIMTTSETWIMAATT